MAVIPELMGQHHRLGVVLLLPLEDEVHMVSTQVEHIWFNRGANGCWYHGFRFLEVEPTHKEAFDEFLHRCRRHKNND
jgi:hypothetical protein